MEENTWMDEMLEAVDEMKVQIEANPKDYNVIVIDSLGAMMSNTIGGK